MNARLLRSLGDAILGTNGYQRLSDPRGAQVHNSTCAESVRLLHDLTDALAELLPDRQRAMIPGAGHMLNEDNADESNHAVRSFLAQHGGPA